MSVEKFVFAKDARQVTPFGQRAFWKYVAEGKIPSYKMAGRNRLFRVSEVVAAIERFRVATADEVLQ